MHVLVISKFDEDIIKNERASLETPFSHYVYGNFFRRSRTPRFHVTCKFEKDLIKNKKEKVGHHFPHYKSMGAFCCHGNQSFDLICPKTLCSLFPHPSDVTHKI